MDSQAYDQLALEHGEALNAIATALEAMDNELEKEPAADVPMSAELQTALSGLSGESAALESFGQTARSAIVIAIAVVRRAIEAVVDFFRSEQHSARRCLEKANGLIAFAATIPPGSVPKREVSNMAMMMMLSFEGHVSRYMTKELDSFYANAIRFRKYAPINEISDMVRAIRSGRDGKSELERFQSKLEDGLKALGGVVTTASSAVYSNTDPGRKVYTSPRMFGDRFIFGQISEVVDGSFSYSCIVKRDASTRMRLKTFPAIKQSDIALCAKSVRSYCEDFLRNIDDENALFSLNREVAYLARADDQRASIKALRTVTASMQNVYIVYTRHAMTVSRNMITYLTDSARAY